MLPELTQGALDVSPLFLKYRQMPSFNAKSAHHIFRKSWRERRSTNPFFKSWQVHLMNRKKSSAYISCVIQVD